MTTKLNFWRYLPPSTHGNTLVFMLITPVGGFHWMPLEESPRPRQIWRRGRDLQGKKIVSYEEGGSNGLVGSDCRSTIALLLTSSATSGDPVEAWCVSIGGGFKPLLLCMDVYGAALFQPQSSQDVALASASTSAFDPMAVTVTLTGEDEIESGNSTISIDLFNLRTNYDLECIERGDVIAHASFPRARDASIGIVRPAMAMGVAPLAFCLCCENLVIVIIRDEGLITAFKYEADKNEHTLHLVYEKRLGRYIVDAAIRSRHEDSDSEFSPSTPSREESKIDIVALVCEEDTVKDGRLITISMNNE